jgi:molybdate transport system ATP-binding protein
VTDDRPALDARIRWVPPRRTGSPERFALDVAIRLDAEVGVLFGPSGSGKTSTLRLIAGLSRPDEGSIRLGETVLFDSSRHIHRPLRRRRVGMIFQDDLLFPHLTAAGNIAFGLAGWDRASARARVDEVADLCGVTHLLDRLPETLSGGERQRVGLARALAPRPRLLLCDEAVSALDLDARFTLIDRLKAVQRAEAIPTLFVTHSPAEAVAVGSKLFLMEAGRVVVEGRPLQALARRGPASALEGMRNVFPATIAAHDPDGGDTRLTLDGGPELIIPFHDRPAGSRLLVAIGAEEILLARGPVSALSARNRIAGVIEEIVPHGREAEILIRTGGLTWIASVVTTAVQNLELKPGAEVQLIIKARSARVLTP